MKNRQLRQHIGDSVFVELPSYVPNGDGRQPTYRIADTSNPILKPWAIAEMEKTNADVRAGKALPVQLWVLTPIGDGWEVEPDPILWLDVACLSA